jgi:hypothetical protein
MATPILSKTVSLMIYPDSQNFDISAVYAYISQILMRYGVPSPTVVSGGVMQFQPTEKNVIQNEKNLVENLSRVAEEINNNNALNFSVGLGFSISQDSINALNKSISDAVTQFESIKKPESRPEPEPILPEPEPERPICPQDMFECPDGSFVGRDEFCNFRPCPQFEEPEPTTDDGAGVFMTTMYGPGPTFLARTGIVNGKPSYEGPGGLMVQYMDISNGGAWYYFGGPPEGAEHANSEPGNEPYPWLASWRGGTATRQEFPPVDPYAGVPPLPIPIIPSYAPKFAKLQFITAPTSDPIRDEYRAKQKFVNMYMDSLRLIAGNNLEGLGRGFSLGGRGGFQWDSTIALQTLEQENRLFDLVRQASTDPDFGAKVVVLKPRGGVILSASFVEGTQGVPRNPNDRRRAWAVPKGPWTAFVFQPDNEVPGSYKGGILYYSDETRLIVFREYDDMAGYVTHEGYGYVDGEAELSNGMRVNLITG